MGKPEKLEIKRAQYSLQRVQCWKWVCRVCELESVVDAAMTERDVRIGLKIHLQLAHGKTEAQANAILGMK